MRRLVVAALVTGCGPEELFIERAWPTDHTAIVAIASEGGAPLGEPRLLPPDNAWQFEIETSEPFRVHVLSYAPSPVRPDLSRCRATYGEGDELPTHDLSLATELLDGGGIAVLTDSPPPSFPIRVDDCVSEPCPTIATELLPAPPIEHDLLRVVAVSDELAFFAGGNRSEVDREITIGRIDGRSISILPPVTELVEMIRELTNGGANSIYGLTDDGTMFLLRTDTASIARLGRPSPQLVELSSASDGTLIGRDLAGDIWRFASGSTIPTLDQSARFTSVHIFAVRRDRIASTTPTGAIYFFDGTSWREEQQGLTGTINDLTGDELAFAAAGGFGPFLLREGDSTTWRKLDRPFPDEPTSVAATGRGEFVVVGRTGSGALWDGGRWCPFDTPTPRALHSVSVAPQGTIAFAVGESEPGAPAVIVRIELPQR